MWFYHPPPPPPPPPPPELPPPELPPLLLEGGVEADEMAPLKPLLIPEYNPADLKPDPETPRRYDGDCPSCIVDSSTSAN